MDACAYISGSSVEECKWRPGSCADDEQSIERVAFCLVLSWIDASGKNYLAQFVSNAAEGKSMCAHI